jgi:uncharacterized membrane protein YkoI
MKRSLVLALALMLVPIAAVHAATPAATPVKTVKHRKPANMHPKITEESARATALARVPGGTVKGEELEREHGHLIYSYDVEVAGKPGIEEVHVDAMTGKVLATKHETAKTESKEKEQESKEATKAGSGH